MPSIRKRIGYLPSLNIKNIITKIAKEEKLSQSKVVGKLVEEALLARGFIKHKDINKIIDNSRYRSKYSLHSSSLNCGDHDELISDKGIIYDSKRYKSNNSLSEDREAYNEDLYEKFKQFILFQKMLEEKQT